MNVIRWLSRYGSAVNAHAVIQVDPDELADVEAMLKLLDGDTVGHYGLKATLVSVDEPPKITRTKQGALRAEPQFGFPPAHALRQSTRFYAVFVDRD